MSEIVDLSKLGSTPDFTEEEVAETFREVTASEVYAMTTATQIVLEGLFPGIAHHIAVVASDLLDRYMPKEAEDES